MGKQPFSLQQKITSSSPSRHFDSDGCFQGRLGSSVSRVEYRSTQGFPGETMTHQCLKIKSSQVSSYNLSQENSSQCYSLSNRQYDYVLSSKTGRYSQFRPDSHSQGNLGIFNITQDQDKSQIHPQKTNYSRRLGITECKGFHRLEVVGKSSSIVTHPNRFIEGPQGRISSLIRSKSLKLVAWMVSGKIWQQKTFQ